MTKKIKINWNAMTAEMIDPAIVLTGNSSETLQLRVHKILVAVAVDWHKSADQKLAVQRVNFLLDSLADGMRKQAVVAWVTSPKLFGMLVKEIEVAGKTAGTTKTMKVIAAGKMKAKKLDLKFITNSHWLMFTKEPEFKAFDLTAKITALLVEADRVVKRADKRQKPLPKTILDALRNVEKLSGVKA